MFESSVNSEGIETKALSSIIVYRFASSVNSEGIETAARQYEAQAGFESSVNSEGIETHFGSRTKRPGLRAV